jgi:hypothetical protein
MADMYKLRNDYTNRTERVSFHIEISKCYDKRLYLENPHDLKNLKKGIKSDNSKK